MERRHRVTTFHVLDSGYLRPTLSAGGNIARVGRSQNASDPPTHLLVQALQFLWLVKRHDSYKCSLTLTIVSYPNPFPGELPGAFPPHGFLNVHLYFGALSGRHSHHGCTMSACFHRIAAKGRWAQAEANKFQLNSL